MTPIIATVIALFFMSGVNVACATMRGRLFWLNVTAAAVTGVMGAYILALLHYAEGY